MVAFVNDDVAVLRHQILDLTLSMETLDNCDVDDAALFCLPSADLADRIDRQIEERGEPFTPLIQKLSSMNQYQCVCSVAPRSETRRQRFSESRPCAQHAFVVLQESLQRHPAAGREARR